VEEAGIVVKIVEGPALLRIVLGVLDDQRHDNLDLGQATHGSLAVVLVVVGNGTSLWPETDTAEVPLMPDPSAVDEIPTSALLVSEIASGARSPMIPSRKGKVPGLPVPVETGSDRVIEVGTEMVEKIPASLSSLSKGSRGICSPARLILYSYIDFWYVQKRCAALDGYISNGKIGIFTG